MKKPDLNIPTYDASLFRPWSGKKGVAFVSNLDSPFHKQVWEDACDTGFWVKGKGPEPKLFTLSRVDEKRDVCTWHFVSEDGFEVVVYND